MSVVTFYWRQKTKFWFLKYDFAKIVPEVFTHGKAMFFISIVLKLNMRCLMRSCKYSGYIKFFLGFLSV